MDEVTSHPPPCTIRTVVMAAFLSLQQKRYIKQEGLYKYDVCYTVVAMYMPYPPYCCSYELNEEFPLFPIRRQQNCGPLYFNCFHSVLNVVLARTTHEKNYMNTGSPF